MSQDSKNIIDKDLPLELYLGDEDHHSSKHLKSAKKSLRQYYWDFILGKEKEPTGQKLDFGNAFETALLVPEEYEKTVAEMDEETWKEQVMEEAKEKPKSKQPTVPERTSRFKELKQAFEDENADKQIISQKGEESREVLDLMLESCKRDRIVQQFVNEGEYQTSLFWQDPDSGLLLRTRPDIAKPEKGYIVDVKTCQDASPEGFAKYAANLEIPIQAALHILGAEETGYMEEVKEYYWLAVEKHPPYNAQIHALPPNDRDWVIDQAKALMRDIAEARSQNFYPGYTQRVPDDMGINDLELPLFYRNHAIKG